MTHFYDGVFLMTAKRYQSRSMITTHKPAWNAVIVILTALRKFVGYVLAVGLNITKNLNVQANNNLYIDLSWINIAL